jgi:phospholipid transport system substrate-binding protein
MTAVALAFGIATAAPLGAMAAAPADDRAPAKQVIERFDHALLSVMKDAKKLGYQGRYEALGSVVKRTFNLAVMAQVSVGGYWDKFTPAQRDKLVDAFTRLSVANYASRFDGYSGETFHVTGETKTRGDAVVVGTEIASPDGDPVAIRYIMRPFEDGWKIVDVLLKGSISELATKRSEYTSILARGGLDALLDAIERKVKALAAG